jgi:hypothetical protein
MKRAHAWIVWLGCVLTVTGGLGPRNAAADDAAERAPGATSARGDLGSSSREARRRAIEALRLAEMPEPQRRAIEPCLAAATLYRRLPVETISCDGPLLDFALSKPEAIVDIWRVLGISRLSLDPVGEQQWRMSDGYGTVGVLRLIHHERSGRGGTLVFHGRGAYAGPLSPKNLSGTCVLLVRHAPAMPAADGRERHSIQIDSFLDVDGVGLEIVTRTLQPLIVRSAAMNFHEISLFMSTLSDSARTNPEGVAQIAARLPRTDPADRDTLAAIARRAARPAGGRPIAPAAPLIGADADRLQTELAARWLSADELDRLQTR